MRRESTYFTINPRLTQIQEGRWGAGASCGQAVTGTPGVGCRNASGSWDWREQVGSCCVTARTRPRPKAEKHVLCVPEVTETHCSLTEEGCCVTQKSTGAGMEGWLHLQCFTVGLKICSFPHVRVPGEQLLCFQPALAISAPTCAWGPLWPLATPVLLHPSRAP